MLDCGLEVTEFERQLCYYVHFRIINLRKSIEPLYSLSYDINSTTIILLQG